MGRRRGGEGEWGRGWEGGVRGEGKFEKAEEWFGKGGKEGRGGVESEIKGYKSHVINKLHPTNNSNHKGGPTRKARAQ